MRVRSLSRITLVAGFCALVCLMAGDLAAQDDQAAMMEAWQKAGTPGEPHKLLQEMVGTWKVTSKSWMDPSAPPMESTGTAKKQMLLDGRYLQEEYDSAFMGMPYHGMGLTGYDNLKQEYAVVWIDNMSTGMMTGGGTYESKTKALTVTAEYVDAMTGKEATTRLVTTLVDAKKHVMEMYNVGPDGQEYKSMEMVYERQ
jgi:hypothetical protein